MANNAHAEGHEHHALPIPLLVGCWLGLMALTGLTVWTATSLDLGQFNLVLAMVIATAKATLVLTIFMHLAFEKGFNFMIFAVSVMAVILFVTIAFIDVQQYQPSIDRKFGDIAQVKAEAAAKEAAAAAAAEAEAAAAAEEHEASEAGEHGDGAEATHGDKPAADHGDSDGDSDGSSSDHH